MFENLNLTYNSTLEGSVVLVQCDGFEVEAFCHKNGSWSLQLTQNLCDIDITSPVSTGEKRCTHTE